MQSKTITGNQIANGKRHFVQGLEGYFRDAEFDQNTLREPGKR